MRRSPDHVADLARLAASVLRCAQVGTSTSCNTRAEMLRQRRFERECDELVDACDDIALAVREAAIEGWFKGWNEGWFKAVGIR